MRFPSVDEAQRARRVLLQQLKICCFHESELEFHEDYGKHSRDVKRCGKSVHTKLSQSNCSESRWRGEEERDDARQAFLRRFSREPRQRIVSTRCDGRSCAAIVRGLVACPPRGCRSSRRSFMCLTILPTRRAMKVSVFGSSSIFSSCLTVWLSRSKSDISGGCVCMAFFVPPLARSSSGSDSFVQAERKSIRRGFGATPDTLS